VADVSVTDDITRRLGKRLAAFVVGTAVNLGVTHYCIGWLWTFATLDSASLQPVHGLWALSSVIGLTVLAQTGMTYWYLSGSTKVLEATVNRMSVEASTKFGAASSAEETARVDERVVKEFAQRFQGDPSYRPLDTLESDNGQQWR
jgi:hypothetical protein